jgi:hypothetical protein
LRGADSTAGARARIGILLVSACMAGCALNRAGLGEIPDASVDGRARVDGGDRVEAAADSNESHEGGGRDASIDDAMPSADSGSDAAPGPDAAPCQGITSSCGPPGACADCTNDPRGSHCLGETCGCAAYSDCPVGQACSLQTNTCTTSCAGGLQCNGGCCDGASCQAGSADNACGSGGQACTNCAGSSDGPRCLDGGVCGCTKNNECTGQQCQQNQCQ